MVKNPKVLSSTNVGDVSDDVKKLTQQAEISLFFREKEKDLDELRKRRLDIQRENREIRDEIIITYPRDKQVYVKDKKTGKIIPRPDHGPGNRGVRREFRDPGNGDLFGEGKVIPDPEPWMPMDTSRKGKDGEPTPYERGQGKKLTFSDTRADSSRFTAAYEQNGFKEDWIKREMESRGYFMTGNGPKALGYTRALSETESMWFKQKGEWAKKKSDFLLGELREQNKNGWAPAQQPTQSADTQAADAQAAQTDAGTVSLQSPVVKSVTQPGQTDTGTVSLQSPAPESVTQPGQTAAGTVSLQSPAPEPATQSVAPFIRMASVKSADGRVSISGLADKATEDQWTAAADDVTKKSATDRATGTRVGNSGRYVKSGTIFFGSNKGFKDYMKREGII